ncbi:hypothetical protein FIV42_28910 [Persicimonas caeni]|uniref:Uncharacterized protein n=1 Tax=Persicimonas caeni TaxID=2292766 RepID=A0A4Y6Q1Z4_PERCE|nr:hypothetical protein [Persicimonas caeni]QDG54621.1 hypothetical protein FIV42_28910 [Persicimonas caeni]QED35842.1 hypothetical protein FRD00_28905 [Persicimonas caeni]
MADKKTRYDKKNKTMWVYREFDKSKTLVPSDELQGWVKQKQSGETDDGEPLEHVNYVFADEQTAEYNHQPMSFSNLGVYVGDLDDHEKYQSEEGEPEFSTKKDFGIE